MIVFCLKSPNIPNISKQFNEYWTKCFHQSYYYICHCIDLFCLPFQTAKWGFHVCKHLELYYNKTVQAMNDSKPPNNYSDLLSDFEKHDKWSLSTFLKENERGNNCTQLGSKKKKICILNVDTRPLERFSIVKAFENMSFPSVAAYNNLFYGKK